MSRPAVPGGPYLVVGLGRSGMAIGAALAAHGEVIGVDAGPPGGGPAPPFECRYESDGVDLLDRVATVVKSPGVPREAAVVAAALERGIEVSGELELAWRMLDGHPFVAVTGTNGKTTTVELLGAIWRAAGLPAEVAGNVGRPVAALVGSVTAATTVLCECSSFQLEDSSAFAPSCAVLLNVAPDHLDRHGTLERYTAAKLRIFANQTAADTAVVPAGIEPGGAARVVRIEDTAIGPLRLPGAHNADNARAAAAAATAMGVPDAAIRAAAADFPGVPNRLETVAERGGVLYVNDSKATNPAAAVRGIEAFEGGVHVILGGSLKGGGFAELREPLRRRCVAAYLIGTAAPRLAEDLDGTVALIASDTLERAVAAATAAARPGQVVLLSPACASFDAFADYEARGERFRELVRAE